MTTTQKATHTPGPWLVMFENYAAPRICLEWSEVEELVRKADVITDGNVDVLIISIPYALAAPALLEAAHDALSVLSAFSQDLRVRDTLKAAIAEATTP